MDSFVDTPEGRGTVIDVDLLRQRVKVRMEDSPETATYFANTDIAVLRSGKAKKNDPPIPADLAPISGSGKRVRKLEPEEKLTLDPIRFRYSTEAVVEESAVEEREEAPAEEPKASRSRRRRRSGGEKQEQPEKKSEPKEEKKEQPKEKQPKQSKEANPAPENAEEGNKEAPKKPHRRRPPYRHNRKPKQSGEG